MESKTQTKQTSRTETESLIWRTFGWLPDRRWVWGNRGKKKGLKSTNW